MPPFIQSILAHHSMARGGRSTALHALQWVLGMFIAAIPTIIWAGAPIWLIVTIAGAIAIVLFVFLGAYIYLLIKNPDALRSEHFSLSKMALEKGLVGDSISGLTDPRRLNSGVTACLPLSAEQGERE